VWSCDTCGRPTKSNPLICDTCGAAAPGADPVHVSLALQRDLRMEAHLSALAFWYRVGAVLMVVLGFGFLGVFGWLGRLAVGGPWRGPGALWAGTLGYVATLVLAAAAAIWLLGHFLARFVNGARIAAAVLSVVSLATMAVRFVLTAIAYSRIADLYTGDVYLARPSLVGPVASFVLATAWMLVITWTLFSGRAAQVCAPTYRTIVARTAELKAPMIKSPFFLVPLAVIVVVALMIVMVLIRLPRY
jgi:hypothetical protein